MLNLKITVVHQSENEFTLFRGGINVTTKSAVREIKRHIRRHGQLPLTLKTKYGCECERLRIVDALRRDLYFESVQTKGPTIIVQVARSRYRPSP